MNRQDWEDEERRRKAYEKIDRRWDHLNQTAGMVTKPARAPYMEVPLERLSALEKAIRLILAIDELEATPDEVVKLAPKTREQLEAAVEALEQGVQG